MDEQNLKEGKTKAKLKVLKVDKEVMNESVTDKAEGEGLFKKKTHNKNQKNIFKRRKNKMGKNKFKKLKTVLKQQEAGQ